jgi:hypothetical protein
MAGFDGWQHVKNLSAGLAENGFTRFTGLPRLRLCRLLAGQTCWAHSWGTLWYMNGCGGSFLVLLGDSFRFTGMFAGLVFLSVLHPFDVMRVGGSGFSSSSGFRFLGQSFGNYSMRINKNHPNIIVIQTTAGNNDTNNENKFKSDFTMFLRCCWCWIGWRREDKNQGHHSQNAKHLQVT